MQTDMKLVAHAGAAAAPLTRRSSRLAAPKAWHSGRWSSGLARCRRCDSLLASACQGACCWAEAALPCLPAPAGSSPGGGSGCETDTAALMEVARRAERRRLLLLRLPVRLRSGLGGCRALLCAALQAAGLCAAAWNVSVLMLGAACDAGPDGNFSSSVLHELEAADARTSASKCTQSGRAT
jgi:hypothetical protein